jgi:two-component system CheB/CheR fusion protein
MPETSRAHLIAVSGYGQEKDRLRSRQAGFDLHLVKPVDPVKLSEAIARA